jgi:transglutaminase-like putative cysteine protease
VTFQDLFKTILGFQETYWKNLYILAGQKIIELNNQLIELQNQNQGDDSVKPSWLDMTVYPYKPYCVIEEGKYTLDDPRDIYSDSTTLKAIVTGWNKLPVNQRLMAVWNYVIDALTYAYDISEDWQFPIITYYRKQGDCEDGTILFIELCKLAGIKADSVFNCCGWYHEGTNKYGHSYPIAKMEDDLWYIFETTIDNHPTSPKLFKGSNYDASWGVCNWKYYGKIQGGDQV